MDKAFGRAAKIERPDRDRGHRARKTTLAKLEAVRNILDDTLGRYVTKFPSLDQIHAYHVELIRLLIGEDRYRMTIGGVDRARHNIVGLVNRTMQQIGRETDLAELEAARNRTYGRVASIIRDMGHHLSSMADMRATLKRMPTVVPDLHTVVIAGYPNVGKSSLIRALTNAEPEVASYPFTTKSANVGHLEVRRDDVRFSESVVKIQLIDTPGLLDRPEAERNAIEHQASLALRHLADVVLFIRDPTGHCGYPVDVQERLLAEVDRVTGDVPVLVIESKIDVDTQARQDTSDLVQPVLRFSSITGDGIQELIDLLVARVTAPPEDAQLEAYLKGEGLPSVRATPDRR